MCIAVLGKHLLGVRLTCELRCELRSAFLDFRFAVGIDRVSRKVAFVLDLPCVF